MRTSIRIAALLLGGVMFIGCDKKDNTTVTPAPAPPAVTAPNTSKLSDAAKNTSDTVKTDMKNGTDAVKTGIKNGTDSVTTEAHKLLPATMPALPK